MAKVREPVPANSVQAWRGWRGITQADLANRVGVTRQTIANIEKSTYSPSVHLALAICREFRTTVEEVFGKDQHERPE